MYVFNLIKEIKSKYDTYCPYEICKSKDIAVVNKELAGGVKGFAVNVFEKYVILLDSNLSETESRFTLAHELGHIFLKHNLNVLFLTEKTMQVTDKFENAANKFATILLLENALENQFFNFYECLTAEDISRLSAVPLIFVEENKDEISAVLKERIYYV